MVNVNNLIFLSWIQVVILIILVIPFFTKQGHL